MGYFSEQDLEDEMSNIMTERFERQQRQMARQEAEEIERKLTYLIDRVRYYGETIDEEALTGFRHSLRYLMKVLE